MMRIFLIVFLFACPMQLSAQQLTVSGQVRDAENGELLGGVSVWDSLSGSGTHTNAYGFFSLTARSKTIKFSYVGYKPFYYTLSDNDRSVDVRLKRAGELDEVVIQSAKTIRIPGNPVSLPIAEIRRMPSLLGEADVLKAFSFTPGVSTGNEGSAGLYVRGGTPDQNLILLDEVPVYNVMHLGGFFSVFNPASLKNADLYKGAFPARFGGRLSSVIDLTMKEGNNQKFGGEVGLGLLNQSLTLEGPIAKNKASFIVSGRVSTLGLSSLLPRKRGQNTFGESYTYKFHDLNAKLNYQIGKSDHLYLSFYNGFDRFKYTEWQRSASKEVSTAVGNNWGNNTGTLRYSKTITPKLFSKAVLVYSHYTSQFTNYYVDGEEHNYRNSDTKITDIGGKVQFDYFPGRYLDVRAGGELVQHRFSPFNMTTNYTGQTADNNARVIALESSAFIDTDIKPVSWLSLNAGGRYTAYKVGERTFRNVEPRAALNLNLLKDWKFTASSTVMNQYIHLLVNNGYGFGFDAWVPATERIPPSRATQWSLGVTRSLSKPDIDISLELYKKQLSNMIDYPEGTNFSGMLADSWENIVKSGGEGRVSGLEMMAVRNSGKLRGRVSYTLSKSELKFEGINGGRWYPMRYDRRHNLNFSASYAFNKKWSVNSTFMYQTGHALTLPTAAILNSNNQLSLVYKERHNGRMPAFHKLDAGISRNGLLWDKYKTRLSFGVYNAYNRANPLYMDFKMNYKPNGMGPESVYIKQYSMFPILPFINYNVEF